MQKDRWLEASEAASVLVAASVLCSLLAERSFTQQSELASEILCWTILLFLPKTGSWLDASALEISGASILRPTPLRSLWAIAAALAMSCVYKAETGMVELLQKLVPQALTSTTLWPIPPSIWGTTLCALVATVSVSQWGVLGWTLSIFAVIPQLYVYITFLPKTDRASRQLPQLISSQDNAITDLAWRAVVLLTGVMSIQGMIFGLDAVRITHALFGGVAKAMSWILILRSVRENTCQDILARVDSSARDNIMSRGASHPQYRPLSSFLITSQDSFTQSSNTRAVFNVVASGIVLAQIIHMLPKRSKAKSALWIFLLASLVPYLANALAIRGLQSSTRRSFPESHEHPVELLVNNAKISFERLVQRQSQTYTAACDEYRRRYSMEPPDGFQDWYKFATAHQSALVDEFDTIHNSVSPFWKLSGTEVLQTMYHAHGVPGSELWLCVYSHTKATTRCKHPRRTFDRHIGSTFDKLLGNLSLPLPDIKFLVNHLDEPRVLIPPQSPKGSKRSPHEHFNLTDLSRRSTWNALTKHCKIDPQDSKPLPHEVQTFGLPIVTNISSAKDLCQHSYFQEVHGLLMHPTSFRLVEGQVPILSTGSLSTMSDILYPSPAYFEPEFQYDEAHDIPWESKQNNLYWAGSTTGGYASDERWRHFHRQRLVSLAQDLDHQSKQYTYLRTDTKGVPKRVPSSFLNRRLFDVAFTRIFQCTRQTCRAQNAQFKTKPWADKHKAFHSRLAFDIDGNGISGRYYQLLASKSVPLKQTLLREWHDDRLVPWVHYIPISQSMEEVPELVAYLTYSETGQRVAREIAESGREWYSKAFREVDFSIYVYRLLLEIARLQDPMREAVGGGE